MFFIVSSLEIKCCRNYLSGQCKECKARLDFYHSDLPHIRHLSDKSLQACSEVMLHDNYSQFSIRLKQDNLKAKLPQLKHVTTKESFTQHCYMKIAGWMTFEVLCVKIYLTVFNRKISSLHAMYTPWKYSFQLMCLEHSNTSYKSPMITTLKANREKLGTSDICCKCTCIQKKLWLILQSNNANSNLVILSFPLLQTQKHFPLDLLFSYLVLAISNSSYFNFFLISPDSLK